MARLNDLSPIICLMIFCSGMAWSLSRPVSSQTERESTIQAELAAFPDRLGEDRRWVLVKEVPIPTNQTQMLGLVGHVSREYQRLGVSPPLRVTVFLAHAKDARSMAGHHPPNCYPASGWIQDLGSQSDLVFQGPATETLPIRLYRFKRGDGNRIALWVGSGFLLPTRGGVATLEETKGNSNRSATSRLGLTQYQIVMQGDLSTDDVETYASEILGSLPSSLFNAVVQIQGGGSQEDDGDQS